jgi:hypothetical protein
VYGLRLTISGIMSDLKVLPFGEATEGLRTPQVVFEELKQLMAEKEVRHIIVITTVPVAEGKDEVFINSTTDSVVTLGMMEFAKNAAIRIAQGNG